MKFVIALLCLSGLEMNAFALGHLVPKWGFEKNVQSEGTGNGERTYGLEYLFPIGPSRTMQIKGELGGWIARQSERRSSIYFSASWGYRVLMSWGLFLEAFIGPGVATNTDAGTSSHFEIFHDLNLGWLSNGYGLSIGFKHISNAGLVPPNLGRDFLGIRFLIPI